VIETSVKVGSVWLTTLLGGINSTLMEIIQ